MPPIDARIDAYIEKSADFAKPILRHIRQLVHKACPDIQETWKWSFPHFDYKGTVCSMAAFKQHCAFTFRKASLMKDPEKILKLTDREAMGHFDKITSLKALPADKVLIAYIKEAVRLNEEDVKLPSRPKETVKKDVEVPAPLAVALQENKNARKSFEGFSPSHRKEYIDWIMEAKTEATRLKRIETALGWIADGKSRHWKYARK